MAISELFTGNVGLAVAYTILGGFLGIVLMSLSAFIIPKIVDKLTPAIDDEKEILRGNLAVATYVGKVTQAVILGVSIIVAAAIIAGMT
jgi:hypothetical protein